MLKRSNPARNFESYHSTRRNAMGRSVHEGSISLSVLMQTNYYSALITKKPSIHGVYRFDRTVEYLNLHGIYVELSAPYESVYIPHNKIYENWEQLVDEGNVG